MKGECLPPHRQKHPNGKPHGLETAKWTKARGVRPPGPRLNISRTPNCETASMRRLYEWLRYAQILTRLGCLSRFCDSFFRRGNDEEKNEPGIPLLPDS